MQELPRGLRLYLICVHLAFLALLAYQTVWSPASHWSAPLESRTVFAMLAYVVLSAVCEHIRLQIRGGVWQNLGTTAHIGAVLLFAPPYPMIIVLAGAVVSQLRYSNVALVKRGFNVVHPALSVGITGLICSLLFQPDALVHQDFITALPEFGVVMALFYAFDIGMAIGLFVLLQHESPWQIWRHAFRHVMLPELGAGTLGILVAVIWTYNPSALVLLILPVGAMRVAIKANAQAEERAEALRLRGSQLETVLNLGQHLRLQLSQADLMQSLAEAARAILKAEAVTGYLRDEEDGAMLRRTALAPPASPRRGPAYLSAVDCTGPSSSGDLCVPIEPAGEPMAGLLFVSGIPEAIGTTDRDVLSILMTQAAIALRNAHLHERALSLAAHDSLTDLLNRRAVQTRLEEEVARANRGGHPLCLLMIDLDDFSAVNNTYGHHTGDITLRAVARALATGVRAMDVVSRYGGDEFVALLPETTLDQGLETAERLLAAVAALFVTDGPSSVTVTTSIGVAALPEHGSTPEELLRAADQAAYAAKHAGKGRVARPEDTIIALDRDPVVLAQQLAHANMATVAALAAAVDAKDPYTQGHSQRVGSYSAALATAMGLPAADVARIQLAGQLHDVGKIGVPDVILTKPGRLSADEYQAIQQHPVIGERMLSSVPFLRDILLGVRHHHERWDGEGYPDGLSGSQIPMDATILAVADAFDAMTSSRPYRSAVPVAEARRRILEGSGKQFDPQVAQAFDKAMAEGSIDVLEVPWETVLREAIGEAS